MIRIRETSTANTIEVYEFRLHRIQQNQKYFYDTGYLDGKSITKILNCINETLYYIIVIWFWQSNIHLSVVCAVLKHYLHPNKSNCVLSGNICKYILVSGTTTSGDTQPVKSTIHDETGPVFGKPVIRIEMIRTWRNVSALRSSSTTPV